MSAVFPQKHLTDIAEWHRMGEAGIFPPDSRLELIAGEILTMAPIGFNHAGHLRRLNTLLTFLTVNHAIVSIQSPIQLGDLSEPEPDLALLSPNADFYSNRHPKAEDVLLLVEISDSTLRFDREQKRRLYATHMIPEYWIVNLIDDCLEVYRQPQEGDYLDKSVLTKSDSLNLLTLPEIKITVADIL
ncbi:Uma2 family endonuclease [Methylomonas sp. SURF-2]|uniref:Uma2 family endonuclease n=1 Tax=Methylomonas subterranea TaxID=2952225 RepID=A0ABT1TCC8_9GAMM|nr:Uma2 family endonuclease [Methylomonas sp. SURF-2]MCQ8103122.1 Uma2 family endonuclease [Methylomonas sp. SURF-2]